MKSQKIMFQDHFKMVYGEALKGAYLKRETKHHLIQSIAGIE
jgi:hypothetical protein